MAPKTSKKIDVLPRLSDGGDGDASDDDDDGDGSIHGSSRGSSADQSDDDDDGGIDFGLYSQEALLRAEATVLFHVGRLILRNVCCSTVIDTHSPRV